MPILMEMPYVSVELRWNAPLVGPTHLRARQLRGALAQAFIEDSRFHQHDVEGHQLYRYPHIQYRWQNGYGFVVGWSDSAEMMLNISWLDLPLTIGNNKVMVSDAIIYTQYAKFGISEHLGYYDFISPALLPDTRSTRPSRL